MEEQNCKPGRREEFLETGLRLLAEAGPKALTAVRLTSELNVTTGSFYWHFDSVDQFHDCVRQYWKTVVKSLVEEAEELGGGDSTRTLENLASLVWRRNALTKILVGADRSQTVVDLIGAAWTGTTGMEDPKRRFKLMALTTAGVKDK